MTTNFTQPVAGIAKVYYYAKANPKTKLLSNQSISAKPSTQTRSMSKKDLRNNSVRRKTLLFANVTTQKHATLRVV